MNDDNLPILQGTLDILVLKALANEPLHGYAVARWIRETTDDALQIEEGALYTALHRLEKTALDRERLGPLGEQSEGQVLRTHGRRQEAAPAGIRGLGPLRGGRLQGPGDSGGGGGDMTSLPGYPSALPPERLSPRPRRRPGSGALLPLSRRRKRSSWLRGTPPQRPGRKPTGASVTSADTEGSWPASAGRRPPDPAASPSWRP